MRNKLVKTLLTLFSPSIQRDVPAEWSEKRDHTPLQPRRDAKTRKKAEKTHRLTSGASFPPRLLISWMIEVVVVMLQTREGSEVAPERECERWNGNKRFRGGGTRRKTARENGRCGGSDRPRPRDSRFSPECWQLDIRRPVRTFSCAFVVR